ncbi:MAG: hypothetical protein WB493_12380 [Anaeromyxobacteraceae bacterium]
MRTLEAEIVQVKEGRYWARPMTSRVKLHWTPARIEWETVEPVQASVVIEGDRVRVTGIGTGGSDVGAAARDPRVASLLRFLRALVAFDLPSIERDYELTWQGRTVEARPRPSTTAFLDRIRLTFDEQDEIHLVELTTPSEVTRLEFLKVERTR